MESREGLRMPLIDIYSKVNEYRPSHLESHWFLFESTAHGNNRRGKILTFRPRPQEQHHLSLVAEVSRRLPLRLVFDTLDSAKLVGVTEYDVSQTTLNEVLLSFLSFICVTGFFMHCRTSSWGNIVLVMDRRQISTFEYSHLTD